MSEPVIKAKAWMCGRCHNDVAMSQPELGCVNCHYRRPNDPTPDEPLYTRDDLVRVAEASRQMAWVQVYNELKSPTIVFEETPSEVVDRLTKGDV